jgi:parallel beta-helix repeat protein/putative cofactor-binding repeat protein
VFVATTRTERYLSFVNCTDFTVRGITSKGATATVRSGPTRGISLEGCSRFTITGNRVYNTEGVGIYAGAVSGGAGCVDGRISDNLVHDTWADGIHITGTSKRMTIHGNVINESGDDSIAVVSYGSDSFGPCEDVTISNNVSWHSKSRGITIGGGKNITVGVNTVRDSRNAGIYAAYESSYVLRALVNVTITGNTITGANTYGAVTDYAGIHIVGDGGTSTPVSGVTVVGNTIEGSRTKGLLLGSAAAGIYGATIAGNTIRNSGQDGMVIQRANNVAITTNTIDASGETGLTVINTDGAVSVTGNVVTDANRTSVAGARRGIFIGSPNFAIATVAGNTVRDSTGNSTVALDFATSVNVMAYGNNIGGNVGGYPIASAPAFVSPGNVLLAGAFPTSGLGSGVGVIGIRNATTAPSTNPTSGGILYAESGAARWRTAAGTISTVGGDVTSTSANYTALVSDRTVLGTGGASGITVTLPTAVKGARFEVAKVDSGAGAVTVATTSSQTINGVTTKVLAAQYDKVTVVSNGTAWFIV